MRYSKYTMLPTTKYQRRHIDSVTFVTLQHDQLGGSIVAVRPKVRTYGRLELHDKFLPGSTS
jgi:hypothetical protein